MDSSYSERKRKVVNEGGLIHISFFYKIPHTNLNSKTYSSYNILLVDTTGKDVIVTLESNGEMDSIRAR
jgi:hypothetical protein